MNNHRIMVANEEGLLTNFITQSAVVRLLAENVSQFPKTASATLASCHLNIPSNLVTCSRAMRAIDAFKLLRDNDITAMPILGEGGHIIGNLSVRDIRGTLPAGHCGPPPHTHTRCPSSRRGESARVDFWGLVSGFFSS